MTLKMLPPDDALLGLAKIVNAALKPDAGLTTYRLEADDRSVQNVMIYQYGSRRATVTTRNVLTAHDAPEIIKAIREWIERVRPTGRWTLDPEDAGIRL